MLHAETRKKELVDKLYALGLCMSYDHLLQLSAGFSNNVHNNFDLATGVCPPGLQTGFFTTVAVDNLDHNPSSTTCASAFHGTAISVAQHCVTDNIADNSIGQSMTEFNDKAKTVALLPLSYTDIEPIAQPNKDIIVPECSSLDVRSDCQAAKLQLMNVVNNCLARKADKCRTSHHVKLLYCSMLNRQHTKVVTAGILLYSVTRICHARLAGVGSSQRILRFPGNHCGLLCRMSLTVAPATEMWVQERL